MTRRRHDASRANVAVRSPPARVHVRRERRRRRGRVSNITKDRAGRAPPSLPLRGGDGAFADPRLHPAQGLAELLQYKGPALTFDDVRAARLYQSYARGRPVKADLGRGIGRWPLGGRRRRKRPLPILRRRRRRVRRGKSSTSTARLGGPRRGRRGPRRRKAPIVLVVRRRRHPAGRAPLTTSSAAPEPREPPFRLRAVLGRDDGLDRRRRRVVRVVPPPVWKSSNELGYQSTWSARYFDFHAAPTGSVPRGRRPLRRVRRRRRPCPPQRSRRTPP